jgi:hypothetical protein
MAHLLARQEIGCKLSAAKMKTPLNALFHMSSQLQMMQSISNKFFGSPTPSIPSSGASSF